MHPASRNQQWNTHLKTIGLLVTILLQIIPPSKSQAFVEVPASDLSAESFTFPNGDRYKSMSLQDGSLYIGGKGHVYIRSSANISEVQRSTVVWEASQEDRDNCLQLPESYKGPMGDYCFNYVRSVVPYNNTHMIMCGTQAVSPKNMFLDIKSSTVLPDTFVSAPLCSHNPSDIVTSQRVSEGGAFSGFVATSIATSGKPKIVKNLPNNQVLQTSAGAGKMLSGNVDFVSSFTADDVMDGRKMKKVYVVFNEKSQEQAGTRIAQVCANDQGGSWKESDFTSFLKVALVCEVSGTTPFRFSSATDVTFTESGIIYGTFYSKNELFESTAVCAFRLSDVQDAFHSGKFWVQSSSSEMLRSSGEELQLPKPFPGTCAYDGMLGIPHATSKDFPLEFTTFMSNHPFVSGNVMSSTLGTSSSKGGTLAYQQGEKFVKIAVYRQQALDNETYDVMFVASASGAITKIVKIKGSKPESRQLARYQLSEGTVSNLLLSPVTSQLYVDTANELKQMSISNCESYSCPSCAPCRMCVMSRDPMCAWDPNAKKCVSVNGPSNRSGLLQSVTDGNATICGDLPPMTSETQKVVLNSAQILGDPVNNKFFQVTWLKDSKPLPPYGPTYTQTGDGRIEFRSFSEGDLGTYVCQRSADGTIVARKEIQCVQDKSNGGGVTAKTDPIAHPPPVGPITSTKPGATNVTATIVNTPVVPPTNQPQSASSTFIIVIIVVLIFVLVTVGGAVLYLRKHKERMASSNKDTHGESNTQKTPRNNDAEDQITPVTYNSNSNNYSNRETIQFKETRERRSDYSPLMKQTSMDVTDSANPTPTTKKVATVTPMNFEKTPVGAILFMDETAPMLPPSGDASSQSSSANSPRKLPARTKSIPANRITVSLGADLALKWNSIQRHPKRGTLVVELDVPDEYDIDMEGTAGSMDPLDLSFLGTETPETARGSPESARKMARNGFDTDSDSTLKGDSRAGGDISDVTSSTTSTPRARPHAPPPQPFSASSYNRYASPRGSTLSTPSRESPQQPPLRDQSTRLDKSPISTTSSSSTSSADKYVTPPRSPVKVA